MWAFLLKSLERLKETREFNLLLVGDGEGAPAYQKQAIEMGLGPRVKFAGAIRDRELLRQVYAAADIFVLPSPSTTTRRSPCARPPPAGARRR